MPEPSYSTRFSICFDGAQASPMPCVPAAYETSGRADLPTYVAPGTKTVPVTAIARPLPSVEEYMTRVAVTTFSDRPSGSGSSGAGSDRMSVPGVEGMVAGGS
uniref:Uncharacterized protein n=1 Tax=Janibacter limosus TaxID=53458 RepID=A0AC61U1Y3_9MICO|nr:hypothetical protein [Janibacter limosus]